jgi:hypothetical protein
MNIKQTASFGVLALLSQIPMQPPPSQVGGHGGGGSTPVFLPGGSAEIPPIEIWADGFSIPSIRYARFDISNTRPDPINLEMTFYQDGGTVVYDGDGPVEPGSNEARGFTMSGQYQNYVEASPGAPTGTPSVAFSLQPHQSCTLVMRAGTVFMNGPWPTPLAIMPKVEGLPGYTSKGFRGYGIVTWQSQQPGVAGPGVLVNGSIWATGDWALLTSFPINGGRAF